MITKNNQNDTTNKTLDSEFNLFDRLENFVSKFSYHNISMYTVLEQSTDGSLCLSQQELIGCGGLQDELEEELNDIYKQLRAYRSRKNEFNFMFSELPST